MVVGNGMDQRDQRRREKSGSYCNVHKVMGTSVKALLLTIKM